MTTAEEENGAPQVQKLTHRERGNTGFQTHFKIIVIPTVEIISSKKGGSVLSVHYPSASLKPHRAESLQGGHLWIFSGALQQPPYWVEVGGIVDVKSATGQFVARGYYNPHTDIAIRILTRNPEEAIDVDFLRQRIRNAQMVRKAFDAKLTNAYRLIHAEGDGLPGLVVDRYADILVMQLHTAGMERLRPLIIDALMQETGATGILMRNESHSRRREDLPLEAPMVVAGEVPEHVLIRENGVLFEVDCWHGQKTGFFLDQRKKRAALRKYTAGKRVLNCFSYTGGFSVNAALTSTETHVTSVDISEPALEAARENFLLNGIDPDQHDFFCADVFDYLQAAQSSGELFDVVVLDPPAFAKTHRARANALDAYLRLNMLGLQVLRPGGILLTCSCSGTVSMDDFRSILLQCAQRLRRPLQALEAYSHGMDHPVHNAMPETAYLKTIFYRVG